RIKEKFFKANNTVRGSGIGLAVADEIIKHHNGLLLIDSTEGVGTTVTVVLPTVKKAQSESIAAQDAQITHNSEEN
ncbi:MAG: sensor histidine kinase, partial [Clostridia bacterium]|nr:sensor histidine kinase [Clostridia bacterium]